MFHSTEFTHPAAQAALEDAIARIRRHHAAYGNRFPNVGVAQQYALTGNSNWLAGFWTGLLWLAYCRSGDAELRQHAEALLASFDERLDRRIHITHDLGFLFTLSARIQWQLTGDEAARTLALRAADELVQRYRPVGRYIQAWGPVGDTDEGGRIIIDTMMNLPLLFWATTQTGDARYHQAACDHAETSMRYLMRPDGSTYHTFFFNQQTGAPLAPRTHQGHSDDSLWARGQAWAIYGFALAAEWCQDSRFLETAWRAVDRLFAELPADGVPTWDLRLPADAPHYRDSSAGAIAAMGLLRLARLDPAQGAAAQDLALRLLRALLESCAETEPDAQGLLRHGCLHAPKGWAVDTYLIFGDYFFLEALFALDNDTPDFWGPRSVTSIVA